MRTEGSQTEATMSTPPLPPCSDASVTDARAAQTRDRAEVIRLLPPASRTRLVNAFLAEDADVGRRTKHPWRELQRHEHYHVDEIVMAAIRILEGTAAGMTPRQVADLEQGATYLIRRREPVFVKAARELAAKTLLSSADVQTFMVGRSKAEQEVFASRWVSTVLAAVHGVMEAEMPVLPKLYLKAEQARGGR